MRIVTYNVNGIRSALRKGFLEWLGEIGADIVCLQEVRAGINDIDTAILNDLGYRHIAWHSAEKKGYSGVAIWAKQTPRCIVYGYGCANDDPEGRVVRADFEGFSVLNVYMPSGTSGEARQQFKYVWLDAFYDYIMHLRDELPNLVVCGDYNIAHTPLDIHNPKTNKNSSGFLPEERAWLSKFFASGFVDAFRCKYPEQQIYTWWSSRANARAKNLGWRIDYGAITEPLRPMLKDVKILTDAVHSDHCPVLLEFALPTQ